MNIDKANKIRNILIGIIWALIVIALFIIVKNWWQGLNNDSKQTKSNLPSITINNPTSVDTQDNCVVISYSMHNNTDDTIRYMYNVNVCITSDSGSVVAKKTFSRIDTGQWKKHEDNIIRFIFYFPNEADSDYFYNNSRVYLTIEMSDYSIG